MDLTKSYPRPGEQIVGGYAWLARLIDKARAYNQGTLGDNIYPCPIDKELLAELNLTGEEFAGIVEHSPTDEDVLRQLGLPQDNPDPAVKRWTQEFLENRHDSLMRQAEEEGRVFTPPEQTARARPYA